MKNATARFMLREVIGTERRMRDAIKHGATGASWANYQEVAERAERRGLLVGLYAVLTRDEMMYMPYWATDTLLTWCEDLTPERLESEAALLWGSEELLADVRFVLRKAKVAWRKEVVGNGRADALERARLVAQQTEQ